MEQVNDFGAASPEALSRAHTREYLSFLESLEAQVLASEESVPFTPQVCARLRDILCTIHA